MGVWIISPSSRNVIATHISPRFGKSGTYSIEAIRDEIGRAYTGRVFIAEDFDVYALRRDGSVEKA